MVKMSYWGDFQWSKKTKREEFFLKKSRNLIYVDILNLCTLCLLYPESQTVGQNIFIIEAHWSDESLQKESDLNLK